MKKIIIAALAVMMILAGCNNSTPAPEEQKWPEWARGEYTEEILGASIEISETSYSVSVPSFSILIASGEGVTEKDVVIDNEAKTWTMKIDGVKLGENTLNDIGLSISAGEEANTLKVDVSNIPESEPISLIFTKVTPPVNDEPAEA